jgi:hypothetical protein
MLDLLVGNWRCWVNDSKFWPFCVRSGTHGGMDRPVDITMDAFGHLGGWTRVLVLSVRVGGMEQCIGVLFLFVFDGLGRVFLRRVL